MEKMNHQKNNINITGYSYIDEPINEILNLLSEEDVATYIKTFKDLYKAGITEGIRREKMNKLCR